jgi:Co/Zn/Cd efflux system component
MGVVGALVIARWSWGLIRDSGSVLLDRIPDDEDLPGEIREALETDTDRIADLHVWQVGPGHHAAIISLVSSDPAAPSDYKARLAEIHELSHITVEVERLNAGLQAASGS